MTSPSYPADEDCPECGLAYRAWLPASVNLALERAALEGGNRSAAQTEQARDELAEEFAESVAAHASFAHIDEPFFPAGPERDGSKSTDADARTFGWSMAVKGALPHVVVTGAPELNFRYVEREIIPTRTQHRPTTRQVSRGSRCVWTSCSRMYLQGPRSSAS